MAYIKTRDKNGNRVYEPQYVPTPRNPEERRSFPLSYWRKTALDRIQLPNGQSVAVDLPTVVLTDKDRPARIDGQDFAAMKRRGLTFAQALLVDCPECESLGYVGDKDVGDVELCPLCQGIGKIVTHFGAELIKFLQWLDSPSIVIDEKGVARMNKIGALRREAAQKKKEASKRLGGDNLDWMKQQGGQKALAEYTEKAGKAFQKIDAELEAAIAALDEKS
jgi:hypothetical protein